MLNIYRISFPPLLFPSSNWKEKKKEKEGRKIKSNEIDRRCGYLIPANSHTTTTISHPRKSRASVSSSISAPRFPRRTRARGTRRRRLSTHSRFTRLQSSSPFLHRYRSVTRFGTDSASSSSPPSIDSSQIQEKDSKTPRKRGREGKREILETPEIQEYRKRSNNNINSSSSSWIGSTLAETSDRGEGGACIDRRVVMRRAACAPLRGVEARAEGGGTRIEARVSLVARR